MKMHCKRTDAKMAEGLWKIFFKCKKGFTTWLVFIDDPRGKSIEELNRYPRLGKGKQTRQLFHAMGLAYVPKKERQRKKFLKNLK